jgi:hypothetical protein
VAHSGFGGGAVAGALTRAEVFRDANQKLTTARNFDSGRWAFNQARNDKSLQSRLAVNEETNSFIDRSGRTVEYDSIQQVGGKAYYMRQGQWVDSTDNAKLKERVVQLYSDEYFDLLRKNKDFARSQRLGWATSVNIGEERIVVEKDGKRVDEELLKKSQSLPQVPSGETFQRNGFGGQQQFEQQRFQNFDRQGLNQIPNEINQAVPVRDGNDEAPQQQEEQR